MDLQPLEVIGQGIRETTGGGSAKKLKTTSKCPHGYHRKFNCVPVVAHKAVAEVSKIGNL